jgi:elongation factor G
MRVHSSDRLRNVALVGHGQSGKTSLAEAMLYAAGVTERLGMVEAGTTVSDSDPEEVARKISISLALLPLEWGECKLNVLDSPGYADFMGEVACALRAADGVMVVVDAANGVGVQTERYAAMAAERGLARMAAITKLDKEHTDFARTLAEIRERLGCNAVAVTLPIGGETALRGVVDLVKGIAYLAGDGKESEAPIPEEMGDLVAEHRAKLMEAAAEADDGLMEKYIEEEELSPEEIVRGLRAATVAGKVVPTVVACGTRMLGVRVLLDTIVADLPGPLDSGPVSGKNPRTGEPMTRPQDPQAPLSALIFKTTTDPYAGRLSCFRVYSGTVHSDSSVYNATRGERERIGPLLVSVGKRSEGVPSVAAGDMGLVAKLHGSLTGETLCDESNPVALPEIAFPRAVFSVAVKARSRADEDKVGTALSRLEEEDPTMRFSLNPDTKETILEGMGDLHLEVVVARLQRKFGVEVQTGAPKIPYRETIRQSVRVQGRHKKQTGGRGQFGDVWVRVEPLPRGTGFEFVDGVRGASVPRNFIPAVEKGLREASGRGVLAGYPVIDIRCTLDDGSSHSVDSSDMAFKIAGSIALQRALEEGGSTLLEPIVGVEVVVPAEHMGDVIGGLNSKRGSILGMEPRGNVQVVRALAPLAEMATYASELRSLTGGRGSYSMQFSHYQEVPAHLAPGIIAAAKQQREQQASAR